MTVTEELLPCPFCGGEAHFAASSAGYAVECDGELCLRNAMQEHPSEEYAALWWNTRSITAAAVYGYQAAQETCRITSTIIIHDPDGYETTLDCGHVVHMPPEDFDYCPSCGKKVADDSR